MNDQDNYLHLGPWSLLPCEDIISDSNPTVMENPWNDRREFENASAYTYAVYEAMLKRIADYLNDKFNTHFDLLYWKILIGIWLWHFVNVLYDRYILIKEVSRRYPDFNTVLLNKRCYITPHDTTDFFEISANENCDFYNLQLFSYIISETGRDCPSIDLDYSRRNRKGSLRNKLKGLVASLLTFITKQTNQIVVQGQVPPYAIGKILIFGKGKIGYFHKEFSNIPQLEPDYTSQLRRGFSKLLYTNEFEKILVRSLAINFPVIYLEGFIKLRSIVNEYIRDRVPKIFCSVGGLLPTEFGKFYLAELTNRGSRVINVQHGGNYGVNRYHQYEAYEISISDKFWCWGWAGLESDYDKLEDAPSLKLSSHLRLNNSNAFLNNDSLLFVGTSHPRYLYRFWNFPVGTQWGEYLKGQIEFIQKTGKSLFQKIVYRPGIVEFGWKFPERIKRRFPTLKIDDINSSFIKQLQQCRLVVIDHNATCFLETLAVNHPTIVFFDHRLFEIRDSALRYFNMLKKVGIFFETPGEAAQHASRIYDDVGKWWLSEEVQHCRSIFVKHFALSSPYAEKNFAGSLLKELNGCSLQ